ncbi:centromere protein N isoform X1 [Dendropsophus ebraccatus]|uniref:centromere protein N isoform X1 n=1 Tax=Dendropsophus ebraccatus TaxID=150705 RepID=UPI003831A957
MAPTPGSARKARRQSISIMDERLAEFIKRMILRMPLAEVMPTLKSWGFLAEKELESLALLRVKDSLAMEVVNLCESKKATIDHAADLDIVYTHANTKKKTWDVYQMSIQSDEMNLVDVSKLRVQFKKSVKSVLKNVTIHFKEFEDALWIRIAWGRDYVNPNQYRPTFVVYHSQTPYVFITNLAKSYRPVLFQGLLLATGYSQIQEMELKSRCLESLKSIVFKQFSQPFQSYQSRSIPEKSYTPAIVDPKVTYEDIKEKERVHHVMLETFGDGPLPKLEFASYKLETSFKGEPGIANKIEPFRCLVKFSSPHLLESIRNLAPLGLSEVPISNLLTCIPHRGRNIFKISEKKQATSSQALN